VTPNVRRAQTFAHLSTPNTKFSSVGETGFRGSRQQRPLPLQPHHGPELSCDLNRAQRDLISFFKHFQRNSLISAFPNNIKSLIEPPSRSLAASRNDPRHFLRSSVFTSYAFLETLGSRQIGRVFVYFVDWEERQVLSLSDDEQVIWLLLKLRCEQEGFNVHLWSEPSPPEICVEKLHFQYFIESDATAEEIRFIYKYCDAEHVSPSIARADNTPTDILLELTSHPSQWVRYILACRRRLPSTLLKTLSKDPNLLTQRAVAERRDLTEDLIEYFSRHYDWEIRYIISQRHDLSGKVQSALAGDHDFVVRESATKMGRLSDCTLTKMENDIDPFVRDAAQRYKRLGKGRR
jgi:hypothetical protein